MPRSKIDPVLRAQFTEVAREIILRDRRVNKLGRSSGLSSSVGKWGMPRVPRRDPTISGSIGKR